MSQLTSDRPRTLHVEHCMGTVFTIDIRDPGEWSEALADVCRWLHHVDDVFSTYRPDSDISRMRRGEIGVDDAAPDVGEVLDLCAQMQRETHGYFSALIDGQLDPTGLVKGWAIERASDLLHQRGSHNHAVNGGGDMQIAGAPAPGEVWRIGITDPNDTQRVIAVVAGHDLAVATSGTGERGTHILNPFTGARSDDAIAATVVGRSLTRVDSYATAAFVMGPAAVQSLERVQDVAVLVVRRDGTIQHSAQFPFG